VIPIAKPLIGDEEINAVTEAMRSGQLAQGKAVAGFEDAFAKYVGAKHAVACTSGTTAIHLALMAAGIGPGDEVITSPFSFIASATPILFTGAKPVFVDIEPDTFNISVDEIRSAVTDRTRAIIPVHLYGLPADMDPITEMASDRGITVVEDACQAHGATYNGVKTGALGDMGCFSFYPTKNMTCGEGGMVTTNSDELDASLRLLRSHGQKTRYEHVSVGYNFRMTDMAASIGQNQLRKLDGFNAKRMANAELLTEGLNGIVKTPTVPDGRTHVFHQYTVLADRRDQLVNHLSERGIGTGIYYPVPIHRQPIFQDGSWRATPMVDDRVKRCVSLPVHPALSDEDIQTVTGAIKEFYS